MFHRNLFIYIFIYILLFFVPAMNDDWAGTTSVAFIHLPEKQEQGTAEKERRTEKGFIIN